LPPATPDREPDQPLGSGFRVRVRLRNIPMKNHALHLPNARKRRHDNHATEQEAE
jgi:hypothetical protein